MNQLQNCVSAVKSLLSAQAAFERKGLLTPFRGHIVVELERNQPGALH